MATLPKKELGAPGHPVWK